MKTKLNSVKWFLVILLFAAVTGTMAQTNQNPTQDVCIGPQVYSVDDIPGATFTWTLSVGAGGTFAAPSNTNTITVNWTVAGGPYTLSVQAFLGTCPGNITSVDVTVYDAPVGPTLLAKTPDVLSFCAGSYANVSATFNPGTGGVGCSDEFQYRIDGGAWLPYIEGSNIPTATATNLIEIQGRRAGCATGAGCSETLWVTLATWSIDTTLPVSVTIVADANPVCAGTSVTFTASQVNGGLTPGYVWRVNGAIVPLANGSTYTYVPANGDVVLCELTSSEGCGSPIPAVSNDITMTVNPVPTTSAIWHN